MKPTLLVLAAGMGSRYGGLKQMDGLGPNGETIIDYSIYDAVQAGFGKVVYIVREYFKEQFEQTVKEKYSHVKCLDGEPLQFQFVTQELNKIPAEFTLNPERQKPWGTAHAVLMAKDVIHEPFAVINGDDFYDKEQRLTDIVEHLNIAKEADGKVYGDNSVSGQTHVELVADNLCSMNMWGFTPDYFERSEKIFTEFLQKYSQELKKEFYIPFAVDTMIKSGEAKCDVLSTPSHWFGVTYKEDRPGVVAKFKELADKGVYPSPLYNK